MTDGKKGNLKDEKTAPDEEAFSLDDETVCREFFGTDSRGLKQMIEKVVREAEEWGEEQDAQMSDEELELYAEGVRG